MIQIEPIGSFFEVDENGCLINNTSSAHINLELESKILQVVDSFKNRFGSYLKCAYLRGAAANGTYKKNVSDLDLFALVDTGKEFVRWRMIEDDQAECDLAYASYSKDLFKVNPKLSKILKIQSLCIYGVDLIPSLPKVKLDRDLLLNYRWICEDTQTFEKQIKSNTLSTDVLKSYLKVLIRTGFELVFEREMKYTTSLYWSYHSFGIHYPEKKENMKFVLHSFLNPLSISHQHLIDILKFGKWISSQVDKEFGPNSN